MFSLLVLVFLFCFPPSLCRAEETDELFELLDDAFSSEDPRLSPKKCPVVTNEVVEADDDLLRGSSELPYGEAWKEVPEEGLLVPGRNIQVRDALVSAIENQGGPVHWYLQGIDVNTGKNVSLPLRGGLKQTRSNHGRRGTLPLPGSIVSGRLTVGRDQRAVFDGFALQRSQETLESFDICTAVKHRLGIFVVTIEETPDNLACSAPGPGKRIWTGPNKGKPMGKLEPCAPSCTNEQVAQMAFKGPINLRDYYKTVSQGRIQIDVSADSIHRITFPATFREAKYRELNWLLENFWGLVRDLPGFNPEWEKYDFRMFVMPENYRRGKFCCAAGFAGLFGRDSWVKVSVSWG